MGLSNSVVVLLCILGAGGVAITGAATYRFFFGPDEDKYFNQMSPGQRDYLREVRRRNLHALYRDPRKPGRPHHPVNAITELPP